jgi:hypothetical protein
MNPLPWKREHQIAFLGAAVAGACIGIFAGTRQVEPSANLHWRLVGLWGGAGAVVAADWGLYPPIVAQPNFKLTEMPSNLMDAGRHKLR